jgi:AcrR family transcriptional regulator
MYAAFGDKRALFEEALEQYLKTYGAFPVRALQEESNVRRAIERLFLGAAVTFTSADHPPGCLLITATTNCAPQSAVVQKRLRSLRARIVLLVEEKLAGAIASRQLAADVDAHALAIFVVAILQGMSAQARDGATRAELEAIARAALRCWPRRPRR